jgi:hypothetical protein
MLLSPFSGGIRSTRDKHEAVLALGKTARNDILEVTFVATAAL